MSTSAKIVTKNNLANPEFFTKTSLLKWNKIADREVAVNK